MENQLIESPSSEMQVINDQKMELFRERFKYIREDMQDNPYVIETLRVLPVGGFRSAIGSFWNAVVDDLRNKIMFRSLSMFNKEMKPPRTVMK